MAKLIPMITLMPQLFNGKRIEKDRPIKAEPKIAAVLTKLKRAREIPEFDYTVDVTGEVLPVKTHAEIISQANAFIETPVKRKRGRPPKAKAGK